MVGTTGSAVLVIASILFASLLGLGAGGLICLVLRQPWGFKAAAIDGGVAAVVLLVGAFVEAEVEAARGIWDSHETLILFIAVGSAAGRELLRSARRPPR
jgi:hypothetical protein